MPKGNQESLAAIISGLEGQQKEAHAKIEQANRLLGEARAAIGNPKRRITAAISEAIASGDLGALTEATSRGMITDYQPELDGLTAVYRSDKGIQQGVIKGQATHFYFAGANVYQVFGDDVPLDGMVEINHENVSLSSLIIVDPSNRQSVDDAYAALRKREDDAHAKVMSKYADLMQSTDPRKVREAAKVARCNLGDADLETRAYKREYGLLVEIGTPKSLEQAYQLVNNHFTRAQDHRLKVDIVDALYAALMKSHDPGSAKRAAEIALDLAKGYAQESHQGKRYWGQYREALSRQCELLMKEGKAGDAIGIAYNLGDIPLLEKVEAAVEQQGSLMPYLFKRTA